MNKTFKNWLGQITTGHGFMVLLPTLMAALSGAMGWDTAAPLLAASAVGLGWPENTALQNAAQATAAGIANAIAAAQKPRV